MPTIPWPQRFPRHRILVLAALSIALVLAAAASGSRAQAPRALWGELPRLPWDDRPVGEPAELALLDRSHDLRRRGTEGETRRYALRRVHLSLDRTGGVVARSVVEGELSRTLLSRDEEGHWTERFTWERFATGHASGPDAMPVPREIESARGLAYDLSVAKWGGTLELPVDFGRAGGGIDSNLLQALSLDAHTWDAVRLDFVRAVGHRAAIGSEHREPSPGSALELPGFSPGNEPTGTFHLGETRISVAGLTRWGGEPAVLLWFSMQGNRVAQTVATGPVTFRLRGTEFFQGSATISLRDGRVIAGRLFGPVAARTELELGDRDPTDAGTTVILQEVTLSELPATRPK